MCTYEGYQVFYASALVDQKMYYLPINESYLKVYDIKTQLEDILLELPMLGMEYLYMVVQGSSLYIVPRRFRDGLVVVSLEKKNILKIIENNSNFFADIAEFDFFNPIINKKIFIPIANSHYMLSVNPENNMYEMIRFDLKNKKAGIRLEQEKFFDLIYSVEKSIYVANSEEKLCKEIICGIEEPKCFIWNSNFLFFPQKVNEDFAIYIYNRTSNVIEKKRVIFTYQNVHGRYLANAIINDRYLWMIQLEGKYILVFDLEKWTMESIDILSIYGKKMYRICLRVFCLDKSKALFLSDDNSVPILLCKDNNGTEIVEKPMNLLSLFLNKLIQS